MGYIRCLDAQKQGDHKFVYFPVIRTFHTCISIAEISAMVPVKIIIYINMNKNLK